MQEVTLSNGTRLSAALYDPEGESALGSVLLIHGFASSASMNWQTPSVLTALVTAGFRVLTYDGRGHGASQKFYDPADYRLGRLAEDARGILELHDLENPFIMGYSMGAQIALKMINDTPDLIKGAVLGGAGMNLIGPHSYREEIAAALDPEVGIENLAGQGLNFRRFAEVTKSDLPALAACMRGLNEPVDLSKLKEQNVPSLLIHGDKDDVIYGVDELAGLLNSARQAFVAGGDHLNVLSKRAFKEQVIAFLRNQL